MGNNPEYAHEYYVRNKAKYVQYRKDYYQKHKQKMIARSKQYYDQHRHTHNQKCLDRYYEIKRIVLLHYSNNELICACCGEMQYEFLTIDHIIPIKRTKATMYIESGDRLYRKLIKENFPDGYQVLCYNCNCGKRVNGECPHKKNGF